MKLLSIIIPTYNMASLLPRCLDSLAKSKKAELLDILVVNDGSKDNSSEVAHQYEAKYPNVVRVIDKPNGNYGSTINAALPVATGKYVKILDSDDWFDTDALDKFISELQQKEADMVITHFTQLGPKGSREVVRYNTMGREPYTYGKVYDLDDVLKDGYIRFFLMHALTYRTDLLRGIGYRQTEGISYTDTEWACFPTFHAKSILFLDLNLYQYNLDREGQTMAPEVVIRSLPQIEKVTDSMLAYYQSHLSQLSAVRAAFMKQYFENRFRLFYKLYLLDMPRKDFQAEDLKRVDAKYAPVLQTLDLHPKLYPENKLIRIEYISYWHKHQSRWPVWFEKFNHCVDVVVKWLYVRIFRR
jgi:glycosyltransferase involved in cell wall biosynthesis